MSFIHIPQKELYVQRRHTQIPMRHTQGHQPTKEKKHLKENIPRKRTPSDKEIFLISRFKFQNVLYER